MLKGLNSESLVRELIKQTIITNNHMSELGEDSEPDNDILFRYSAVYTEVVNRLEK
jgi:hypothetical protein